MTKSIGINDDADGSAGDPADLAAPGALAARAASSPAVSRRLLLGGAAAAGLAGLGATALPAAAAPTRSNPAGGLAVHGRRSPLWKVAAGRGITFGSASSVRVDADAAYGALVDREASILFTEEDLLWYELKPTPTSALDFSFADQLFARAESQGQLVFAAHLAWDEGFGDGWSEDDLYGLSRTEARHLLFGTERAMVDRYRGRVAGWIVANEVTDPESKDGIRTDVPWYQTIGPDYVADAFRLARRHDRHATLVLNEFGFETTNQYGDDPVARQQATLEVIDTLLADHVPVDALGIQAHLLAEDFAKRFDRHQYRRFLRQVARRGLKILITELDVLDDGLPADVRARDAAVGDIYARYLGTALAEPAVKAVMAFGLSDRYTWLQEDYPRDDGAARRPLAYDEDLHEKPAYRAIRHALATAPRRRPLWHAPREGRHSRS